ncbi:hypothetical protein Sjap_007667 [Stephania japonica]|uniref:X8 domain-containing protein n=1 Tax=Stephania japonica TaxID=461633 RepID=A0AAP0JPQ0_9MAGN
MSTTDYACGAGADCEEIRPQGRFYHSDTMVPHASYAFSGYWQTKKRIGATCDFGGTAMIISFDPKRVEERDHRPSVRVPANVLGRRGSKEERRGEVAAVVRVLEKEMNSRV